MKAVLFFLSISSLSFSLSLRDRFNHAQIGDYVVTEQDKNYCLLFVRQLDQEILVIDEITFSEKDLPSDFKQWQNAEFGKAYPLSWISFIFDRKTGVLEDAYNFTERSWLEFSEEEVFLKGLLNLDLFPVKETERKKIGPTPKENEADLRKNWAPPLILEGVKFNKPTFDVFKGRWAQDSSILSKCHIEMYFSKHDPSLPFPTWIEINNGHYGFKLKGVDAGHKFKLEKLRPLPLKPLLVASGFEYKKDLLYLKIKAPRSRRNFELCAQNPSSKEQIPLTYTLSSTGEKDLFFLMIPVKELKNKLQSSKSYQLVFYPDQTKDFFIKTQDLFICP